jgi:putative copper export protein
MSPTDILLLIIRWLHNISAVAWIGGGLFYLLILRGRRRGEPNGASPERSPFPAGKDAVEGTDSSIAADFRALVYTAMGILLVTGVILTFHRLTSNFAGPAYAIVLAIKITLALYMFYLVRFLRSRSYPHDTPNPPKWLSITSSAATVVILGLIVFLLADILAALFENALKP